MKLVLTGVLVLAWAAVVRDVVIRTVIYPPDLRAALGLSVLIVLSSGLILLWESK